MYIAERKGDEHTWGQSSSSVIPWEATGVLDYGTALALFMAATPLQLPTGLWRQNVRITQQKAIDIFYAEVTYGPLQPPDPNTWQWEIDATTDNVHVTCSKQCVSTYAGAKPAPAATAAGANVIGDDGMGNVEGCDIVVSAVTWTEQHQLLASAIPFGYADTVDSLIGFTNEASFRGLDAGQVLFMGANIKRSSKDQQWVDASYRFRKDRQQNITIQGVSGTIVKPPHHFVDVRFSQTVDDTSHNSLRQIQYVKVHRMYDPADYSPLGIGS
jgi:hypothetical protein